MKKLFTLMVFGLILSLGANAQIVGPSTVCLGNTSSLTDSSSAMGTWSSSNTAIATVAAGPSFYTTVTPVSSGVVTITYTVGSTIDTKVMTVNPAATAITGGGSPFCVGATVALSNATAGGTWASYSTYVATVGVSSGIATGVHAGVATIRYTLPTGCYASTVLTVNATAIDSVISGPSTVCVGSVISLTSTTAGGAWSSSSTAIATVMGAGTGVVTGVAAGAATITYSISGTCGTAYAVKNITVTAGTSAGTLSGASTVAAGSTIVISPSVSGGAWSSSTPGVATVSGSGIVTGVAAGTTTISYAVTGCSGVAYATKIVTVTAANKIEGDVIFGGAAYTGVVKVWLIRYNSSTLNLYASDSTYVYCSSGTSVHYQFSGCPTDSFRVKAHCEDSAISYPYSGYTATYHNSSTYWNTATTFYHVAPSTDAGKNINMIYGTVTSGVGFVGGNVMMGANKGTATTVPSVGLLVYLVNETTGTIVAHTYTDASGNYSFGSLAYGTYRIYPELINYATTPYNTINLTAAAPTMNIADFGQHTLSKTITPRPVSVTNVTSSTHLSLFPNPTSGKVTIDWSANSNENATVVVTDITGRQVVKTNINVTAGAGNYVIDLGSLSAGLYMVNIKSESFSHNTKLEIAK